MWSYRSLTLIKGLNCSLNVTTSPGKGPRSIQLPQTEVSERLCMAWRAPACFLATRLSQSVNIERFTSSLASSIAVGRYVNIPQARMTTAQPKEIAIPMPWGDLAAIEWGPSDGYPVLGLHGWQDNAGTFDLLAPLLPPECRFVSVDMAGHGRSAHYPPGMMYHYWDRVGHVSDIVRHFGWSKFSFIGHSMGGTIGLMYASIFPEQVERLVMLDIVKPIAVPVQHQPSLSAQALVMHQQIVSKLSQDPPAYAYEEAKQRLLAANKGSITEAAADVLLKRGLNPHPSQEGKFYFARDLRVTVPSVTAYTVEQQQEYANQLRCPVLIIRANQGGVYEPKEVTEKFLVHLKEVCPLLECVQVEGTHHVHLNNPERVAPHVVKFLQGLVPSL